MKTLDWSLPFCAALFVVLTIAPAAAPQTAAPMLINYQGKLTSPTTGDPVPDGDYDMVFRIYDVPSGGTALWTGRHESPMAAIRNMKGIFSVVLGSGTGNALDPSIFEGADRWLEIQVGSETLSPRQRIASGPYAFKSEDSRKLGGKEQKDFAPSEHSHSGSDIKEGTVPEAQIDEAMTRDTEKDAAIAAHAAIADAHHARYTDAEAVAAMGARADTNPLNHDKTTSLPWGSITSIPAGFADGVDNDSGGDITGVTAGAGLTGGGESGGVTLSAAFAGTGAATTVSRSDHSHGGDYWSLTGNAATDPATQFVGTSDNQALELRVNGVRAFRLEPNATSPNVIGGYRENAITPGVYAATIAGGGVLGNPNQVTDNYGTVGGGGHNFAGNGNAEVGDAMYPTVGGGYFNSATDDYATISGGRWNTASGPDATVGGGAFNTASGDSATVGGGVTNNATGTYATVGGGQGNTGSAMWATVGGGLLNTANADYATVGGGYVNAAVGTYCTVGGGFVNGAAGDSATVGGGYDNEAWTRATVGGGAGNNATGDAATVGGGHGNTASADSATVGGGASNTASGDHATVGGGSDNRALGSYATIAGGGPSDPANPSTTRNLVTDDYGTIGGGGHNQAGDNAGTTADARFATVGGGRDNRALGNYATIAGGGPSDPANPDTTRNLVTDDYGTIGGGGGNQAGDNAGTTADAPYATVGGGYRNKASGDHATVGGGYTNTARNSVATVAGGSGNTASGWEATVGGGGGNAASGTCATVGGGYWNTASGEDAAVGGGLNNIASGLYATVGGGVGNTAAGSSSLAAGQLAKANHNGAFVWADMSEFPFYSTAINEFSARCTGGARFVSAIDATGNPTAGVTLAAGGGSWSSLSDLALKENFLSMDGKQILARLMAVPISAWNYKAQDPFIRHMGPLAQDFYAAFGLGEDDKHISTVDADGVALAAIQGLHEILEEKDARISGLEKKNTELERRLGALEELVKKLTYHQGDQQ